jgi:outer membrane autotransporter protein
VGTFANVTSDLAFFIPSLSYSPNNVYLLLSRNSFPSAAATENQKNVAEVLEGIYTTSPTGDMSTVMDALLGLSVTEARKAYDQMGGQVHTTVGEATFSSFGRYMGTMTARMHNFPAGGPSPNLATPPVMFASRDAQADSTNMLLAALGRTDYEKAPSWGFWAQGYGNIGDRHGDDISSRYRYDAAGAVFGFDRKLTDFLLLGASVGYSYGNVRMKDLSEQAGMSSYQGSLYGIYSGKPWYLTSVLAYGLNRYNTQRDISGVTPFSWIVDDLRFHWLAA